MVRSSAATPQSAARFTAPRMYAPSASLSPQRRRIKRGWTPFDSSASGTGAGVGGQRIRHRLSGQQNGHARPSLSDKLIAHRAENTFAVGPCPDPAGRSTERSDGRPPTDQS